MPTTDARVDAYIAKAAPFARPILERLRRAFHEGCPQTVETVKWGAPHFEHHGILGSMAAFKKHVSLGFWKGAEIGDPAGILDKVGNTLMCAVKFTEVSDLPARSVLAGYVKRAARFNLEGGAAIKGKGVRPAPRTKRPVPRTPPDLAAALRKNAKARAAFQGFPPSHKREYIEWITEAKRDETRARRLAQAVEWIADGRSRNWKYERSRASAQKKSATKKKATPKKRKPPR